MNNVNVDQVKHILAALLPDEQTRQVCLTVFLASIKKADSHGSEKWGVYYLKDRVRLLVGSLIVFTIEQERLWLALDQSLLESSKSARDFLESIDSWQWDENDYPEYVAVPSRNGYYTPSENHPEIWPVIQSLHFRLIENAAKKYSRLKKNSQPKHNPELLLHLERVLEKNVPRPLYEYESASKLSEEISDSELLREGSTRQITINAYERNPKARKACIEHHGTTCGICQVSLGQVYGEIGEGVIHVHHLRRLADIGQEYEVDPINDLLPVCPNCHSIIHRRDPPYSAEEVRTFLEESGWYNNEFDQTGA